MDHGDESRRASEQDLVRNLLGLEKGLGLLPLQQARVLRIPASRQRGAATVTERGAPGAGQPVVGSSTWP